MASNGNLSQHRFVLNNGSGEIPALGFGTSLSDNKKTRNAVKTAVEVGFRHLDAAERYRNEAEVGAALTELFAGGTVRCNVVARLNCSVAIPRPLPDAIHAGRLNG